MPKARKDRGALLGLDNLWLSLLQEIQDEAVLSAGRSTFKGGQFVGCERGKHAFVNVVLGRAGTRNPRAILVYNPRPSASPSHYPNRSGVGKTAGRQHRSLHRSVRQSLNVYAGRPPQRLPHDDMICQQFKAPTLAAAASRSFLVWRWDDAVARR